jgi:hypothetical protein
MLQDSSHSKEANYQIHRAGTMKGFSSDFDARDSSVLRMTYRQHFTAHLSAAGIQC